MIHLNHRGRRRELPQVTRVLLGVLLGLLASLAAPARPASAHAVLTATTPAAGAVIADEPQEIRLRFSEPVRLVPGRTQVLAPNGKRINDGDPVSAAGGTLRVALNPTDRPLGTYLVSYRVISADSHPVAGSFTFSVGAPSVAAPRPAREGAHPAVAVGVSAARYLGYAGLALTVGPVLLLATLWPRRLSPDRTRPERGTQRSGVPQRGRKAARPERGTQRSGVPQRGRKAAWPGPLRLAGIGLGLIAAGTLASLWFQAPYGTGAGPLDVSATELRGVLGSPYGIALLARLGLLAAIAGLLPRALAGGRTPRRERAGPRGRRGGLALLAALGVAALATWPLAGHPAASPRPWLSAPADVVHLAAMSVWLGGLVGLVTLVRRADRRELGVILPVWSRWATIAVYWLVAAGVVQALVELGPPRTLVETRYGQLLLVKAGLLLAVLGVAAYSRRLARRWTTRPPTAPGTGAARLRRAVGVEVGLTAVVLAASAVLVQTVPARSADVEAAAAAGARGFATTLTSPLYSVQVEVFPAQVGPYNTLHAFVYRPDGRPAAPVEWTVTGTLPEAGIEPVRNPIVTIRGNQGIGPVNFPMPGRWRLRLTIRVSETEQATVSTTVPVG
jgi:copper transport protein